MCTSADISRLHCVRCDVTYAESPSPVCPGCQCAVWSVRPRLEVDQLVKDNIRLAHAIAVRRARRLTPATLRVITMDDLNSVALTGLLFAARRWKASTAKFSTYVFATIDGNLRTHINSELRRRARERQRPIDETGDEVDVPDHRHAGATSLDDRELTDRLLSTLTPKQLAAVQGCVMGGDCLSAVAADLGMRHTEGVRQLSIRAIDRMRGVAGQASGGVFEG